MAPFDPRPLTKHYFPWLLIALSAPAWAESPAKRQFDTLTVTATRQEERVGDVAGSVDVIDEHQHYSGSGALPARYLGWWHREPLWL